MSVFSRIDPPRPADWPGPYLPLLLIFVWGGAVLTLSRFGLSLWQAERVSDTGIGIALFVQGLRTDIILLSLYALPLAILAPLFWIRPLSGWWRRIAAVWVATVLLSTLFLEAVTGGFMGEYETRPNRLFVEYLYWPRETISMLWSGFRTEIFAGLTALAAGAVLVSKAIRPILSLPTARPTRLHIALWPLVIIMLFIGVRSTFNHRPANPALFAITGDNMVNNLIINSPWSLMHAIYNMKHESKASQGYGKLADQEIIKAIRASADEYEPTTWIDNHEVPTLRQLGSTRTDGRKLNLVIILEESLGATYVGKLGGMQGLTPELERLSVDGWWFENLYATGTRSARGIEAVTTGFLPTPATAVVKLLGNEGGFYTIASQLRGEGYKTSFIYGGEAHFDNMASFFTANGFEEIIDQRHYDNPVFLGSWGVSDEDLFSKADETFRKHHDNGEQFFSLVFTSSNHSPYDYPDGRIELHGEPANTEKNAIRYADYALGRFIDNARTQHYWDNTLFVIVADHDNAVRGNSLIPVERFHIPALILGADITPRNILTIASQIDLPVTALSLIGFSGATPMIGRDISRAPDNGPGRAIMQFNDNFAWMEQEHVVVLRPEKAPAFARYDRSRRKLEELLQPSSDHVLLAHEALAHALLPARLYQSRQYRPPTPGAR
ncbi:MAG: LTA synthase family protein [Alcanivoracaceae bacterium]